MRRVMHGLGLWWEAAADLLGSPNHRTALLLPWLLGGTLTLAGGWLGAAWAGPVAAAWIQQALQPSLGSTALLAAVIATVGVIAAVVAAVGAGLAGFAFSQVLALPWLERIAEEALTRHVPERRAAAAALRRNPVGDAAYALLAVCLDLMVAIPCLLAAWSLGLIPFLGPAASAAGLAAVGGIFIVRQATDPALAVLRLPWRQRWAWLGKDKALTFGFWAGASLFAMVPLALLLLPALSVLAGSRYVAASCAQSETTR